MFTRKPRLRLGKIVISSAKRLLQHNRRIADNPTAAANVRFWTKADKGGLLAATVCPLMTQSGHSARLKALPPAR